MLHPTMVADLLDHEIAVAGETHGRRARSIERVGTDVIVVLDDPRMGDAVVRFDGARYDAEPLGLSVVLPDGREAPPGQWPGSLFHSVHPTLARPFACIRGCFEYHHFPGHTNDPWDHHRRSIRLVDLLDHALTKAGR
jgi:hypothetical protein